MLIDVSSSMAFCTEHKELASDNLGYYGYMVMSGDVAEGKYTGDYDTVDNMGRLLKYDESIEGIYKDGELIMDYNQRAAGSWKGHSLDLNSSGDANRCKAPSRMDVLIESLIAPTTGFIDRIAEGARINGEEIKITLVTFSGKHETTNAPMAKIVGTFDINDEDLKDEVVSIKYLFHRGTHINTGLNLINENRATLLAGENVENYFIFFGDGLVSDTLDTGIISNLMNGDSTSELCFDHSYAIGFGKDFEEGSLGEQILKSLLKDSNDEPIKANNSADIVNAFASIARNISATAQTNEGKLTLSGAAFNDAVENNKVFPIAVMNGNTELFRITSTSDTEISWDSDGDGVNDVTTKVKFNFNGTILKEIVIDLSGTAFSNKKQLNVVLDKQ